MKVFTLEEISKHNTLTDCWIIINDSLYDVTSYIDRHPGGSDKIIKYAGNDATAEFNSIHSQYAKSILKAFIVGKLKETNTDSRLKGTSIQINQNKESMMYFSWILPTFLVCLVTSVFVLPANIAYVPLIIQYGIMSTIVYRTSYSSTYIWYEPVVNVCRCVFGSLLLSLFEISCLNVIEKYGILSKIIVHTLFAYATSSISDYMFHRFIWHAHWSSECSIFWSSIYSHYVQHYCAHHKHANNPITNKNMLKLNGNVTDIIYQTIVSEYSNFSYILGCSNHGITVVGFKCQLNTLLHNLALTTGTCVLTNAMRHDSICVFIHIVMGMFSIYLTFHHNKYHCSPIARKNWADEYTHNQLERWFWKTDEIQRMSEEHQRHHNGSQSDRNRYFGLIPFGRYFIYPIWQSW